MKITLLALVAVVLSMSLNAIEPLEKVFGSGNYAGQQLDLLTWSDRPETLYTYHGGVVSALPLSQSDFGPGWQSGTITQPGHGFIGFGSSGAQNRINPIYWNQTTAPPLGLYQTIETDPQGDHLFTNNALDILYYKASFSGSRFHFAIKNNSTSFPVDSGLTYYSYMAALVNPNADPNSNPPIYGLMYTVNIPTIITPGLYKITGTGFGDLELIGDIEVSVDDQTDMLLLSCAISDLTTDADFNAWFDDANPLATTTVITSRTSITSGTQQADASAGARVLFKPQPLPVANLQPPVLSNPDTGWLWDGINGYLYAEIDYFDPDANYPRICSFSLDGGEEYPLHPLGDPFSLDFAVPQRFAVVPISLPGIPEEGRFRFSHGDGFVYYSVTGFTPNSDPTAPQVNLDLYPNPVSNILFLDLKGQSAESARLRIFNLRGQRVLQESLDPSRNQPVQVDLSALPNGTYMLEIKYHKTTELKRFIKLD